MDLRKLKTLIDLVSESNISELEITEADGKVRIVKADPSAAVAAHPMMVPAAAPMAQPVAAPVAAAVPAAAAATAEAPAISGHAVKSPMVGTFYRAPQPGAPAFVEEGDPVAAGQTLCILEAMKLMNEIKAESDGRVRKILVQNAEPVEYGQLLFELEPLNGRPLDAV